MYGDTAVMRRRAGQLREQGADIRATADRLVARSEAVPWRGRAADAMRHRVKERAGHLRAAAHAHDTAAESLERHLVEVDRLKDAVADAERRARDRYDDDSADVRGHAAATWPPPGHADWLVLELPGS
jgi:hypothetical protein